MRYIPANEPFICTQCGKDKVGLIEIDVEDQLIRYCPLCWELVGHKMAERFSRWQTKSV